MKKYFFLLLLFTLFSCNNEDEILKYLNNYEETYQNLKAYIGIQLAEIEYKKKVNEKCMEKPYALIQKIHNQTDTLIELLDNTPQLFDFSYLDEHKEFILKELNLNNGNEYAKNNLLKIFNFKTIKETDLSAINIAVVKNKLLRIEYYFNEYIFRKYDYKRTHDFKIFIEAEQSKVCVGDYYKANVFMSQDLPQSLFITPKIIFDKDTFPVKKNNLNFKYINTNKLGKYRIKAKLLFIQSTDCWEDTFYFPSSTINFIVKK